MLSYSCKSCKIYDEFSDKKKLEYFDLKKQKFIHNIDSLYYVVYLKSFDFNTDENVVRLVEYLETKKNESLDTLDMVVYDDIDTSLFTTGLGFGMYAYSIEKSDKYIIFIARKKATKDTPEILVQLRSQFLWLYGEHRAVEESFVDLKKFLEHFNIEIERTQENRIDYAYHTNYIQDPLNFFKEDELNKMQVSHFTRWHKEGRFVGDVDVECDYISLGRRKSNNTFVRIYNKCQEVVNQGYKQFFIKCWLLNGLINRFDYYVLQKCFEQGSYNYVDKARLYFYVDMGQDLSLKNDALKALSDNDNVKIRKLANLLVPKLTIICNIEIQTKRKFYATMEDSINILNTVTCKYKELEKIYKILDNKDIFHNFITNDVIRFINYDSSTRKTRCKTANWWENLQNCKMNNVIDDDNRKLIREYQKNLDAIAIKKKVINSLSTLSLYINNDNDNDFTSDVVDFINFLNESDIEEAIQYKKKKSALLKSHFEDLRSPVIEKNLSIIDLKTAEIY